MKTAQFLSSKAFTLMELLVVVIILTILAAFVIPNFQKSLEKSYERNAIVSLRTIAAASKVYRTRNGVYWPDNWPTWNDVTAINADLDLNIIPSSVEYTCLGTGAAFACIVYYPNGTSPQWSLTINSGVMDAKPYCSSASCPTCQDQAGGGC